MRNTIVNGRGRIGMISRTAVWASLVLVCTPAFAQSWNPFAPSDYEECAESAAKTAKTNEALKILIAACASKFAGRRKSVEATLTSTSDRPEALTSRGRIQAQRN